eukprot:TRINITY_DN3832_c0_g2_i1.p1 TRINITY_DN3832_c0_g2~~TRINITY_DN3832_c0_g2_i1.p1  ORF type:complete len:135 (-),score=29.32 TRINITY_DN3832_c0_g2_i1:342-746(-)
MMSNQRTIGLGLTGFGVAFTILGVILFFDGGLLTIGNILFVAGIVVILGVQGSIQVFWGKNRRASVFFFLGIVFVLVGWPFTGFCIEAFGFINVFGNFIPVALYFLRTLPVIGPILQLPPMKKLFDMLPKHSNV